MNEQTERHAEQVERLCLAHVRWMEKNIPARFELMAVIEAYLKSAGACALGGGMSVNETADLIAGFADAVRLEEGEPDPTRPANLQ